MGYQEYYDELVPEHHRFAQLEATSTTTTTRAPRRKSKSQRRKKKRKKKKNKNNQNQQRQPNNLQDFSNFPNFPNSIVTTEKPKPTLHTAKPKQAPVAIQGNDQKAGPFGYIDKGTFFEDSNIAGFPKMIEVVYQ